MPTPSQPYTEPNEIEFSEFSSLPKIPAVYEVWVRDLCLYVGSSKNLFKRWKQGHHVSIQCAAEGADLIRWTPTAIENLTSVERAKIAQLKPLLNGNRAWTAPITSTPEGCLTMSYEGLKLLRKAGISGRLMDATDSCLLRLSGNIVTDSTLASIAGELGIHRGNVSRLLTRLDQESIVYRPVRSGTMYFNPHIAFKGTALQQRQAVRQWDEWHRPRPMPNTAA